MLPKILNDSIAQHNTHIFFLNTYLQISGSAGQQSIQFQINEQNTTCAALAEGLFTVFGQSVKLFPQYQLLFLQDALEP